MKLFSLEMFECLIIIFAIFSLFGVVYPVCAILFYPIYKVLGGSMKFVNYMREI